MFICIVIGSTAVKEHLVTLPFIAEFFLVVTISNVKFISSVFKCVFMVNPEADVQYKIYTMVRHLLTNTRTR